ncbi:MAG: ABC transporter ATP-binding protein [Pleomorphochaeta sp.]
MKIKNLSFSYKDTLIFNNFNLEIQNQTICSIVGPSGCGKTTLLKLISNLEVPISGKILKDENEKGNVSYLFQEPRLLRSQTTFRNLDVVLSNSIPNKKERRDVVFYYLERVGLLEHRDKYPLQLSGGMRQRAAIARAFAYPSHLILMDEPMQGLDIKSKYDVLELFKEMWNNDPRTTLFVTHDLRDALTMGDKVVCLGNPNRPTLVLDIKDEKPLGDESLGHYENQILHSILNK